jgi:PINIT domain
MDDVHTDPEAARETTRDTARVSLVLPPDVSQRLLSDENSKVMVFCGAENLTHSLKSDIAFPHQVELKCNDQEVKGNLRGLKNKPGSTRPADITSLLRKKVPNQTNVVEMVYALTSKVFPIPNTFSPLLRIRCLNQDPHTYRRNRINRNSMLSSTS